MKIRKYYSRNTAEGFQQVRKELGPEAVILQTRRVRQRGLKGWFLPRQIEIIAALDSKAIPPPVPSYVHPEARVETGINELKTMVKLLMERSPSGSMENEISFSRGIEGEHYSYWRNYLQHHDVDPVIITEMFEAIAPKYEGDNLSRETLAFLLKKEVYIRMQVAGEKMHRTMVLIGPTGVGKTTTLAKLAARYSLNFGEKVGLVTIDHFRIGAIDQLATYAEIIDLPLEVVYTPQDLPVALNRLRGCDRVLIDTAGRSTGNLAQIEELAAYMELLLPAEVYLVISATTRWQDVRFITSYFSKLHYNRLLITKMDETASYGAILNSTYYTNKPLVYITNGQSVPDNLKLAREMDFAGLFWGAE